MKTLIITVGTRQVGWRCKDGVVRCFGADGDRGHPPHMNELYQELALERHYHAPDNVDSQRGVRHLGEQYYHYCCTQNDFSPVELLLDANLIAKEVSDGLDHLILWGTDQPDDVSWSYRRSDTLWLAELMAGKIRQEQCAIQVDVWNPTIPVNRSDLIRKEVEGFILHYALDRMDRSIQESFVLMIESKGSAPAIASTLEVCAAALVRDCEVQLVSPQEPDPLYSIVGEYRSANSSLISHTVGIADYFLPLERARIISAWERGDFAEAKLWLTAHQSRYLVLYRLADYLALATNWQITNALKHIKTSWLSSKKLEQAATSDMIQNWRQAVQTLLARTSNSPNAEKEFLLAWESCLLIELALKRQNYTAAFMQFAQILERLLFIRAKTEDWLGNGHIQRPNNYSAGQSYTPGFWALIQGWSKLCGLNDQSQWFKLLNRIREKRNQLVHSAEPVTLQQLNSIWTSGTLFPITASDNVDDILQLMLRTLQEVCNQDWQIPKSPLLKALYEWGLTILRSGDTPHS